MHFNNLEDSEQAAKNPMIAMKPIEDSAATARPIPNQEPSIDPDRSDQRERPNYINGVQHVWVMGEMRWVPLRELLLSYSDPKAHEAAQCTDCIKFEMYCQGLLRPKVKPRHE